MAAILFQPGDALSMTGCVNISITTDVIVEEVERFKFLLDSEQEDDAVVLDTPDFTIITILDTDDGTIMSVDDYDHPQSSLIANECLPAMVNDGLSDILF